MSRAKRKYSSLRLVDALALVNVEDFVPWSIAASPRQPSATLVEMLVRLEAFDLETTEQAKTLLIDALFSEIVPNYPRLKVWKATPLETEHLTGIADYLITPKRAYVSTPLLAVAEAKRDDFVQGRAQCVAEMYACQQNNRIENWNVDVYGIVSNGQTWQFYRLNLTGEVHESGLFGTEDLPRLLGVLDAVSSACAANIP